jgi:nitrogen fixation NifU-like protein
MNQVQTLNKTGESSEYKMLADSGYSDKAIKYYMEKPHMGDMPNPDLSSEMLGTCGDTMKIYLKIDNGTITDIKYQVLGCPGAISAAMAVVDLTKRKSLEYAKSIDDGEVFKLLEEIPAKKHHCIQLAVKTLHKAIGEYESGIKKTSPTSLECDPLCSRPNDCCKNKNIELQD